MKKFLAFIISFMVLAGMIIGSVAGAVKPTRVRLAIWDYSMNPELKVIVESFQKENPGINVEVIDISNAEYINKMTVMLAGGEDVDVFAIKDFPSFSNYIGRHFLTPLDSYIKESQLGLEPFGQAVNFFKDKGKLMALPWRSDIYILFYNKDIFDKAGLPYPTNDMTWDEFREIAKKLTKGSGNDKIWGAFIQSWKSMVMNQGILRGNYTLVDGKYDFLKPAYEIFLRMQNEDKSIMNLAEIKTTNTHYRAFFESGKVGMLYMGSWYIGAIISDKKAGKHDINWGIVKAPHWPGQQAGTTVSVLTTMGINQRSKNKEAAWKLVNYFGGEKGALIHAKYGVLPAYHNSTVLDTYTSTPGFPAGGKLALETVKTTVELPPSPFAAAIDRTLQEEHDLIMTNQKSVDQGIKDMERRVQQILKDE